jgi:multidrug efflux system membrane fusion protein
MTRILRSPSAVILFAAIAGLLPAGCGSSNNQETASANTPAAAVPVTVAKVEQKDLPVNVRSIGNVTAKQTVTVKSQVTAQLMQVHFKEGDDVQKGDLLFTLDPRQYEADLKKAQSTLARDIAQANNAKVQSERYISLMKEGVISKQEYDAAIANAEAADATVAADRAAVDSAKVQLQYTKIYAPISGRTGNLMVHEGNLVKANDVDLVTINQISPIDVEFAVPEQQLPEIKKRMAARPLDVMAVIKDEPGKPLEGRLTFIDNAVDPTTATIKLKGTFTNQDRRLWPGQFVDVVLTLSKEPNALVVPSQAVQTGQNGQFVFIVKPDMTAQVRNVNIGRSDGQQTIITSGLKPGETVVTDGQLRLTDGAKVEVKNQQTKVAQAAPEPLS